ncbi:Udp-n-acetylglucosamine transporter [Mycena sanguinolenta]|uniref:Udp-n-acetylglucosamine transporter n=1 Tax=Mycena sanguinolenta TaxID=230812 RepID=A0A8H6YMB7_9AGAR|nr:Udp-n-acetylglucosamine transporter [Mycena sanguinolenta]
MSVHIIFRSGGLVISMLLGWLISGKRYTLSQVCSVLAVTLGVVLTTLSASGGKSTSPDTNANLYTYLQGISILTLALLFSGFLGLTPGAAPAPTWQESMFYLHFLALPMFFFVRHDIATQLASINAGPRSSFSAPIPRALLSVLTIPPPFALPFSLLSNGPAVNSDSSSSSSSSSPVSLTLQLGLTMPRAYIPLLLNTVTQLVCVAGVHRLTTRVSALTVTLVLVVRKAVSLIISVWMSRGRESAVDYGLMWTGAALVLAGTVGYSLATGRAKEEKKKME